MITFLIWAMAFFVSFIVYIGISESAENRFSGSLLSIIAGFSVFALIGYGAIKFNDWAIEKNINYLETVTKEHKLTLLNDGQSVHGEFFLGSGTVNSKPAFMYYLDNGGYFTLHSVDANRCKIIYTEGTPRLIESWEEGRNNKWWFFGKSPKINKNWSTYTFFVPKGSIKSSYHLDAQ